MARSRPGFERVRDAFAANFERDEPLREVGASLSVYHRGKRVVDLWGGWRDAARTQRLDARHAGQRLFHHQGRRRRRLRDGRAIAA